ncbi:MAG: hypothetical protein WDM80_04715 [Limisphaerales bacterium]
MKKEKIWFGHPEELAKLAAVVSHGKTPTEAVTYALELCRESMKALNRIALEEGGVPGFGFNPHSLDATLERIRNFESGKTVPKPDRFPAKLSDFFDRIVKAKTPADNTKRLRDFFCQVSFSDDVEPESKAAEFIQRIKSDDDNQEGFFTETKWEQMAARYLEWWKKQKSSKARESAKKRKKVH